MSVFHDEIEIEDFEYDEEEEMYYYPCPCGDRFRISKEELLEGEEIAACPSCSLIVKVIYDLETFLQEATEVSKLSDNLSRGGRGGSVSFNREQLNAIGITPGDNLPGLITEPPPLYPLLNRKPVPLQESLECDYLVILRQNILDQMQASGAHLRMPQTLERTDKPQQEINKLIAQLSSIKEKFDWKMLPAELRPKVVARRMKAKELKVVDVDSRLTQLEKQENDSVVAMDVGVKEEAEGEEEEENPVENYEDEDIDDGTDYANNYFDNGEEYEDEEDNLDDDNLRLKPLIEGVYKDAQPPIKIRTRTSDNPPKNLSTNSLLVMWLQCLVQQQFCKLRNKMGASLGSSPGVTSIISAKSENCEYTIRNYYYGLKCVNADTLSTVSKLIYWLECVNCNIPVLDKTTSVENFRGDAFNLTECGIMKLEKSAFNGISVNVRRFNFENNVILSIEPGSFSKFTYLMEVKFRNNKISYFKPETFFGIEVTTLDLSQNVIKNVSLAFGGLTLTNLNLSSNAITEISQKDFGDIESWKDRGYLDLSFNGIQEIHSNSLRPSLNNTCFTRLYLHHNAIKVIENCAFCQLQKLEFLSLESNQIARLEKDAFKNLDNLNTLQLQNNKLSEIPTNVFIYLKKLGTLDLSQNLITNLKPTVFSGLTNLYKLNVSHNFFNVLNPTLFAPLGKLANLDITDVKIHELDIEEMFRSIYRLRTLVINDNFWTCDDLKYFYKVMNSKTGGFNYPTQHFEVPNLHGIACSNKKLQYYDDLTFEEFLEIVAEDKFIETVRSDQFDADIMNTIKDIYIVNCMFVIVTIIAILFSLKFLLQLIVNILRRCHIVKNDNNVLKLFT
ncbi:hypothetical protein FQR65_LT15104 [Abscondita terminalis]|nr:hypothetical protein FQR65_LT15104 [Abscondita terminalis]